MIAYYNFQNKFPHATNLIIQNKNECNYYHPEVQLKIIENPESKINKFTLSKNLNGIIEFYINSFETLREINLTFNYDINIKFIIPIFLEDCKIIFKSLEKFFFDTGNIIKYGIFKSLYDNLDKKPNLKYFHFRGDVNDIEEEIYYNFIRKLLFMKLNTIFLKVTLYHKYRREVLGNYTEKELKKLIGDMNFNRFHSIEIQKFKY